MLTLHLGVVLPPMWTTNEGAMRLVQGSSTFCPGPPSVMLTLHLVLCFPQCQRQMKVPWDLYKDFFLGGVGKNAAQVIIFEEMFFCLNSLTIL